MDRNHHKRIEWAGKDKHDIWEQMISHIDFIEQIYFAGGEPSIMQEHYNIPFERTCPTENVLM